MKLKSRFLVIDILIMIGILGLPILILGVCHVLPKKGACAILFYILYSLSIIWHFIWIYFTQKKGKYIEDTLFFKQYILSEIILLLPYLTLILNYIPGKDSVKFIISLILSFILFVVYYIYYSALAHVSNQMTETLKTHESVRIAPTKVESYENEDGDFVGSSFRKK